MKLGGLIRAEFLENEIDHATVVAFPLRARVLNAGTAESKALLRRAATSSDLDELLVDNDAFGTETDPAVWQHDPEQDRAWRTPGTRAERLWYSHP